MLGTQTGFPETRLLRSNFYARVNPPRFQRLIASSMRSWACQPRLSSFCAFGVFHRLL